MELASVDLPLMPFLDSIIQHVAATSSVDLPSLVLSLRARDLRVILLRLWNREINRLLVMSKLCYRLIWSIICWSSSWSASLIFLIWCAPEIDRSCLFKKAGVGVLVDSTHHEFGTSHADFDFGGPVKYSFTVLVLDGLLFRFLEILAWLLAFSCYPISPDLHPVPVSAYFLACGNTSRVKSVFCPI